MSIERTLSIIKPDAVARNLIGAIYAELEANAFIIIAAKMLHLTTKQASQFYAVHKQRVFFDNLVEFMTSGPVMVQILEGQKVIERYRILMGNTKPEAAEAGTLRYKFSIPNKNNKVQENAVHGSDSPENAEKEINFFFTPQEIFPRTR